MEISALFAPIWRQKWHILTITVISSIALLLYSMYLAHSNYYSYVFFTVAYRDEVKPVTDYDYANYYGNYASIEFARTLSAWPKDPYLIKQVYDDAGVDQDSDQSLLDKLLGNFSVSAEQRANLKVNIRSKSEENLRKLSASFIKVVKDRLDTYNRQSATQYQMINVTTTPYVTFLETSEAMPIGIALGILLGIMWAFIWESWQGKLSTAQQLEDTLLQAVFWKRQGSGSDITPVVALLASWQKEMVVVNNRANPHALLKKLRSSITDTLYIVTSDQKVKSFFEKVSNINVVNETPTKKGTKIIHWLNFPQDSITLVEYSELPTLILAQRGKSKVTELQSLRSLVGIAEKEIALL